MEYQSHLYLINFQGDIRTTLLLFYTMKNKNEIRDAEAEKYADRIQNTLEASDARARSFKAGFDSRDKLDNEALKIALTALQRINLQSYQHGNGSLSSKWLQKITSEAIARITNK